MIGTALNLYNNSGRTSIFIMLSLSILEYSMFLHLSRSFLYLISIWKFSAYNSYTYLVIHTPSFFHLFVLILYPVILLNTKWSFLGDSLGFSIQTIMSSIKRDSLLSSCIICTSFLPISYPFVLAETPIIARITEVSSSPSQGKK